MGSRPDLDDPLQREDGRRVDHRRTQQLLSQVVVSAVEGGLMQGAAGAVEQDATSERVPVRAKARRRQADEDVTGAHVVAGDQQVALDDAHGEADEIELTRLHRAGMLGHLAADERAPRRAAPRGDALDELLDVSGVEFSDGDVVEEEQRLRALAHQVVDAHGNQIDADRLELTDGLRDEGLRPDPVGRGLAVGAGDRRDRDAARAVLGEQHLHHRAGDVARLALAGRDMHAEAGRGIDLADAATGVLVGLAHQESGVSSGGSCIVRSSSPGGIVLPSSTSLRRFTGTSTR